ncbi:MAG: hypothetical protein Q9223_007292, partial [Gallowayella weberi]
MAASISSSIVACLKAFNKFVEGIQDVGTQKPGLVIQHWQDELGRLRIWAANIGAHQTNQSSLDYRLRDSTHIRQQILKLLDELIQRLGDAGHSIWNDGNDDENDDIESLEGSSSEDEGPQTEVQQLQRSVANVINCLFQMSMLVRKPAQHDLRIASDKADVAAFEPFDYNHVRDKYPKADEFIVTRLGHGITRRRKYLKYRERHALKLKQGIKHVIGDDNASSAGVLSETMVTDVQHGNIEFQDNASESGISQTSYAPTLMIGGDITIPAPPRASQGGAPFECPYCYFIVSAQNTRSWNRHVFNDLQPYMCIEKTCTTPDKFYTTRHEWVHHQRTTHPYQSATQTLQKQRESLVCALCMEKQDTSERHERHVARHLQELALFVLPRIEDESDEAEQNALPGSDLSPESSISEVTTIDSDQLHTIPTTDEARVISENDVPETARLAPSWNNDEPWEELNEFHQRPRPPLWLTQALHRLQQKYPEDAFEGIMKMKTDQPVAATKDQPQEDVKYEFSPRIRCKDCPSKLYYPGPEMDVNNFEVHLKNRIHREKVEKRVREREKDHALNEKALNIIDERIFGMENEGETQVSQEQKQNINFPPRPIYLKVHRKHLESDTLDAYELPWEWDDGDGDYLVIKQWINEEKQDELFEHTRKLRRQGLLRSRKGKGRVDQPAFVPASSPEPPTPEPLTPVTPEHPDKATRTEHRLTHALSEDEAHTPTTAAERAAAAQRDQEQAGRTGGTEETDDSSREMSEEE